MRARLYSLRKVNDKIVLSLDLSLKIIEETKSTLKIKLYENQATIVLNKYLYFNRMRVWDDGETFFIVCSKLVDQKYAKEYLIKYSEKRASKEIELVA